MDVPAKLNRQYLVASGNLVQALLSDIKAKAPGGYARLNELMREGTTLRLQVAFGGAGAIETQLLAVLPSGLEIELASLPATTANQVLSAAN